MKYYFNNIKVFILRKIEIDYIKEIVNKKNNYDKLL